uniref:Uncharacterized protein n=1 Tax=Cannabis sativa TaxID=3483 RepID=A0A803QNK4_CANSA
MKFGVVELALITGLNFTKGPTNDEKKAMLGSNQLINLYFNQLDNVKKELLQNKFLACEYWAYEAILEDGKKYGSCQGIHFLRLLSWTSRAKNRKKTLVVMKGLHPRPDEESYARTITYNDAEDDVDVLPLKKPPVGIQFGKRKRVPPTWFKDYTEMKKNPRPSSVSFDPLSLPDERLLDSFVGGCVGPSPTNVFETSRLVITVLLGFLDCYHYENGFKIVKSELNAIMKPWEDLLPSLIHASSEFPLNNQILAVDLNDDSQIPRIQYARASHDIVPKVKMR